MHQMLDCDTYTYDMNYIIGVDFDNTIVSYDDIIHSVAVQRGLIHSDVWKNKKHVRDSIRRLPNGEIEWQRLQAIVYGPRMREARLIEGVQTFFNLCKQRKIKVYIISHKTEYANFNETGTNLRVAALAWMKSNKFFDAAVIDFSQRDVYFESTRHAKIERIKYLGCTHFIDDLEEIFLEDSFPTNVEKILYAPHRQKQALCGARIFSSWKEISDHFFGA